MPGYAAFMAKRSKAGVKVKATSPRPCWGWVWPVVRSPLTFAKWVWRISRTFTSWVARRLDGIGIFPSIVLVMLVAALFAGAAFLAVWWMAGSPGRDELGKDPRAADFVRVSLFVAGGIGAAVALVVAYRRQKLGERNEKREDTKHYSERFQVASEQLGSASSMVRLAGIYAMAHLADDWEQGRQTCIDVLCAYIRQPYISPFEEDSRDGPPNQGTTEQERAEERQVRQTIFRVIAEHLRKDPEARETWHPHSFDLSNAVIEGLIFDETRFERTNFRFDRTRFISQGILLDRAIFKHSWIYFSNARFEDIKIYAGDADFFGGQFSFRESEMHDVAIDFLSSHSRSFTIDFSGAYLQRVDIKLDRMEFNMHTVLDLRDTQFSEVKLTLKDVIYKDRKWSKGVERAFRFNQNFDPSVLPERLDIDPWDDYVQQLWAEGYEAKEPPK